MNENVLINRAAAIAMAEKIAAEIDGMDCDLEGKKTWARQLMKSILPAEGDDDSE